MKKIEELKAEAANLQCLVDCAKGNVSDFEGRLAEKRKEIATLEAKVGKPMRFEVWLDEEGSPVWISNDKGNCGKFMREYKNKIIAIEKKPVRVTAELADAMDRAWCKCMDYEGNVVAWVEALKAINIDAVAADEP